jgi:type III secretory pathway lipoprotein EscJ
VIGYGGRPHRFPHNNFSSVYQIFTKLGHMIPPWNEKNTIYFGVIRSKVTVTINRIFDNRVVSAR